MLMSQETNPSPYQIQRYHAGEIAVNGEVYTQSILLANPNLLTHWRPQTIGDLQAHDIDTLLEPAPELILLGTGVTQQFPPLSLMAQIIHHHIGYEVMDTAAACRIYNLLASEGRRVLAALIIR